MLPPHVRKFRVYGWAFTYSRASYLSDTRPGKGEWIQASGQHSLYNNVNGFVFFKAAGHKSFKFFFIHTAD